MNIHDPRHHTKAIVFLAALAAGSYAIPQKSVNFSFTWLAYNSSYADPNAGQAVHINVFGGL